MAAVQVGVVRDSRAPWLLVPCVLLTLSGVTLLAPHQAAQAAPPSAQAAPKPNASGLLNRSAMEDDDDGDELLEHWGDPQYSQEERLQMAGLAGAFVLFGAAAYRRRSRGRVQTMPHSVEAVTYDSTGTVIGKKAA